MFVNDRPCLNQFEYMKHMLKSSAESHVADIKTLLNQRKLKIENKNHSLHDRQMSYFSRSASGGRTLGEKGN